MVGDIIADSRATSPGIRNMAATPFRAVGRGIAALGRGALDLATSVGQGMAVGEGRGMIPAYLPAGSQGATAQAPTATPRQALPTQAVPVPSQPQAAAPAGAAPSLSQQQTPSLGQQIMNALQQGGGTGF
jgi:hypothetical protein